MNEPVAYLIPPLEPIDLPLEELLNEEILEGLDVQQTIHENS